MFIEETGHNIKINPATGRKLRIEGKFLGVWMSQSEADHKYPGTDSDSGARLTKDSKPSVVTKKTSTKNALANNKKVRHAQLASAPRGELTHSNKQAHKARRSGLKSETSYTITGNIAPEIIELPVIPPFTLSRPAIPTRPTHSADGGAAPYPSVHNVGPSSSALFPNNAKPDVKADPAKSRFTFESFANIDTSFTFVSNPSPAIISQCGDSQPSVVFSAKAHVSNVDTIEKGPTTNLDSGRSIFDALAERCNTVSKMAESERCSEERRDHEAEETSTSCLDCTIVSTEAAAELKEVGPTTESLPAGEREESMQIVTSSIRPVEDISCIRQLEMDHFTRQKKEVMDIESRGNTDLVIYRQCLMPVPKSSFESRPTADIPVATWGTQRMFFVNRTGDIRVVDLRQTLYDINVEVDDGASDFDSIASPMKINPLLAPVSEHDEATSTDKSSDQSSDEVDTDDLADFVRIGCTFVTSKGAQADSYGTPATALSFSDDEDVIDPCLAFRSTERVEILDTEDNHTVQGTSNVIRDASKEAHEKSTLVVDAVLLSSTKPGSYSPLVFEEKEETSLEGGEASIQSDTIIELGRDELLTHGEAQGHGNDAAFTLIDNASGMSHSPREKYQLSTVIGAEAPLMDTSVLANIDTTYNPVQSSPQEALESSHELLKASDVIEDAQKDPESQEAFASDFASELMRTMLGTESLFTFFEHLEASDYGSTTKTAVVTAFLQLINLERKKLGKRPLPSSYTAASVLSSIIVPHTIFLGTSSLATLLAHFSFGSHGETTVDEVYRVFKTLSKEDLLSQVQATKGVMGALGLRLAKLPSFQAA